MNAGGEIRQVFHLRQIERGIRVAFRERGLKNFLPRRIGAIDERVKREGESFELEGSIDRQRLADRTIELQVQRGLIVCNRGQVLALELASRREVEL